MIKTGHVRLPRLFRSWGVTVSVMCAMLFGFASPASAAATVISGTKATSVTPTSAVIEWTTNKSTDSIVVIAGRQPYSDPKTTKQHKITVTNLSPGKTYIAQVRSADWSKQVTADVQFRTLDALSISQTTVKERTDTTITVTWKTIRTADSWITVPGVGTFGSSKADTSHEVKITGLKVGTAYQITIASADQYMRADTTQTVSTLTRRAFLAQQIDASKTNIELRPNHSVTEQDGASALQNIQDTISGKPAKRSSGWKGKLMGPGGTVELHESVLQALLDLAKNYRFKVEELAGGRHNPGSQHFDGKAFDISYINGRAVSKSHPDQEKFRLAAEKLGFKCLGPSNDQAGHPDHIHCGLR